MYPDALLNSLIAEDVSFVTGQQPATVDELLVLQHHHQLNTPTMHPNLVSTLKSIIAPISATQYTDRVLPNSAPVLVPPFSESVNRSDSNDVPHPICAQDPQSYQCKIPHDSAGASIVPVHLIQNRRPFKCSFAGCDKTFRNPQTMKMHHKTHYSEDSTNSLGAYSLATFPPMCKAGQNKKIPSKCPICKKTFVGLYELRRHFGRKHSEGEKMHGCRKCGKKFYIEVDLRDHEKLCGEPLHCKCGMKFAFKCNLMAHKRTHPDCQDSDERKGFAHAKGLQGTANDGRSLHVASAYSHPQQQRQQAYSPSPKLSLSAYDQSYFHLMESFAKAQREETWRQHFPWLISHDRSSGCLTDIGIIDVAP